MSTQRTWHRQPYFWCGWLAGGMVSVLGLLATLAVIGIDPRWTYNVGYAVATIPPVAAAFTGWWFLRRRGRQLRQSIRDHDWEKP